MGMKSFTNILFFTAFFATQSLADDFCAGHTNGYYADPANCIKYYHCFDGRVQEHLTCPKEQGVQECYDPEHVWCNFPDKVNCGDRPICDEKDENCNEATTKKPDDFECPAESGYFADPKNCIKYYHCFNGIPEEHKICPHDEAGKQELYDPAHEWCDHPERVDCGNRPICDENDENCVEGTTVPTIPTDPTAPTTTTKADRCAAYGPCQMSPDSLGPYKAEGPCDQCFCQCVAAGVYDEVCCEPGLVFNERINQCDWPFNIPDCE